MRLLARRLGLASAPLAAALVVLACGTDVTLRDTPGTGAGGAGGTPTTSVSSSSADTSAVTTSAVGTGAGGEAAGGSGGGVGPGAGGTGGQGGQGGSVDPTVDADGDGWAPADGDCCDSPLDCPVPERVNPGAMEFPDVDLVDDDCDPLTADGAPPATCQPASDASSPPFGALELAKALDLCNFTVESPPLPQRRWGLVSASLTDAAGSPLLAGEQAGVLADFGDLLTPVRGETMAALSTGAAADEDGAGFFPPQDGPQPGQVGGLDHGTVAPIPAVFTAPYGGLPFPPPGCAPAVDAVDAHDSVRLRLRLRAPTNSNSFSFTYRFFTAEAFERTCVGYQDFFVGLLQSQVDWLPADTNVVLNQLGYAVSSDHTPFEHCVPPAVPPAGLVHFCASGPGLLAGTGFGGFAGALDDGAATDWLVSDAPVVAGETFELELIVWDGGDGERDSTVLLDSLEFNPYFDPGGWP